MTSVCQVEGLGMGFRGSSRAGEWTAVFRVVQYFELSNGKVRMDAAMLSDLAAPRSVVARK